LKNRIHYLRLFGLNENATEEDIKKAYRKLAKKYHPDLNSDPKAQQIFIDLHEAYERLLNADVFSGGSNKRAEQSFETRRAHAKVRYDEQQEIERKNQIYYFEKLIRSQSWVYFKYFAFFSALFSLVVFIDFFLPTKDIQDRVLAYSAPYNGLVDGEVIAFQTSQGKEVFVKDCIISDVIKNPYIILEVSPILHQPKRVWRRDVSFNKAFEVDFSLWSAFPFFCIFFLIPLCTYFYKQKNLLFILLYYLSCYGVSVVLGYILVTEGRFLHLISLGFI
jgi:hypothetical protein